MTCQISSIKKLSAFSCLIVDEGPWPAKTFVSGGRCYCSLINFSQPTVLFMYSIASWTLGGHLFRQSRLHFSAKFFTHWPIQIIFSPFGRFKSFSFALPITIFILFFPKKIFLIKFRFLNGLFLTIFPHSFTAVIHREQASVGHT